ncbi:peptide chain release factor N(5)-glutamine methyltransferase [Corynebacterium sp. p3-SID1194]|uniref:peptide chain release factor N(5)-glutamine methyltransferase n=1 Tax=Corynebacterium sp. p3-SID1194 TaxID=2916105 RepID=UPI0021A713CC|nr:peptide chain release factor N(5)-glutamine methyltransferase [Corynebacterium sp. p3-SID1194]MCT1450817.1 peptide chain release factor N(5)-glutamine methyltransferase [Corynebacterium sp. p3-SID1194]
MKQSSLRSAIDNATQLLIDAHVASPDVDARLIAAHLLGVPATQLILAEPTPEFEADYAALIARRVEREPLQHILGTAAFGVHDLKVGPGVFIPRPETEVLAEWAVGQAPTGTVVDLGTGSGALAIYIAERARPELVIGVEKSPVAAQAARDNSAALSNVRIIEGDMTDPDLLSELTGTVDLIVANPPYVPFVPEESGELEPEVYRDPLDAVFSGDDGMDAIRGLIPVAARLLAPGGKLGIEHDDTTAALTRELVEADGSFENIRNMPDLTGRDRFVTASKLRTN